ncbi:MAG: DUF4149 domain-containing protein [Pseudomonadota bacterium]
MMETAALLATALLFGGMTLFSFGFAPFVFSALPPETAGPTIRRAFPRFHLFVALSATLAAALSAPFDALSAGLLAGVALTTLPNRQLLTPAINAATDAGDQRRFHLLHGLSVAITLAHIVAAGAALARFL